MSDLTQTKQESPKKRVVGNITTEILVGSAATRLESAAKSILNAMDSISDMEKKCEELSLMILNKESQVSELDNIYKQKEETKKYELDLLSKQYPEQLLNEYLNKTDQVVVSKRNLTELKAISLDFDNRLRKEIQDVNEHLENKFKNELQTANLVSEKETAELKAKLQQKDSEITMYSNTIKRLEQEVREARELTKAVAEAGKIGSINLPSGK